ncbi:glycosyltransferase family 4 protein [Clostridium colicanis]|uniref:Glycogen synthase n=1 Tax=Clostridium colicanis DSM 13634 TaxID=1121305 RepID=A0A151AK03_9CLOT|nr:glycosyltransferase family 4 protein [Clostridium colicanis]KYH27963.1 glycogen synthase [Clostridium colicanis DSM 13634]
MSKILLINTYYYPNMIGGTEYSTKLLAEGLISRGHDVAVFTCDSSNNFLKEEINNVIVYRDKIKVKNKSWLKPIYKFIELDNKFILKKLDYVIQEFRPELINTQNLYYISPAIWKYIKVKYGIPVVHTIRDLWLYCPRATFIKRNGNECKKRNIYCKLHEFINKKHSNYVDVVTAPSQYTLDFFEEKSYFINSKKIVIPNGVDININDTFEFISNRNKINKNNVVYIFIGSLIYSKGLHWLIETFKELNNENSNLIICGDGPLKEYVIKQAELDNRIIYKGYVSGKEKEEILKQGDVLVIPSIWNETFGRVIIEAYKYGMPVIGSNLGGIPEVIKNGETGIIVEANNKNQLRNAMEYFASRENQIKYRENIKKYINKFSINENISSYEKLYIDILS